MWCVERNLQCLFFPRRLGETCKRTCSKLRKNRQFCTFFWVFHYVDFQRFVDVKTWLLDIEHFALPNYIKYNIDILNLIIVTWCMKSVLLQFTILIRKTCYRTNVLTPNLKELSVMYLYSYFERFIMFIFSVLVTRKSYFWTLISLANKTT